MRTSVVLKALGYCTRTGVTKEGMAGLSVKSLKKNYFLIPLIGTMTFATLLVLGFSTRMALRASDVSWKKEEAPYDYYADKQYKFINIANRDFKQDPKLVEARNALKAE